MRRYPHGFEKPSSVCESGESVTPLPGLRSISSAKMTTQIRHFRRRCRRRFQHPRRVVRIAQSDNRMLRQGRHSGQSQQTGLWRSRNQFSQLHDLRGTDSSQRREPGPYAQLCYTTKRHERQSISWLHTANEPLLPLLWDHSSPFARAHERQSSVPKALAGRD